MVGVKAGPAGDEAVGTAQGEGEHEDARPINQAGTTTAGRSHKYHIKNTCRNANYPEKQTRDAEHGMQPTTANKKQRLAEPHFRLTRSRVHPRDNQARGYMCGQDRAQFSVCMAESTSRSAQ